MNKRWQQMQVPLFDAIEQEQQADMADLLDGQWRSI